MPQYPNFSDADSKVHVPETAATSATKLPKRKFVAMSAILVLAAVLAYCAAH